MIVSNAVYPTQEQFRALLEGDFTGAVCMVNLLEFKSKVENEDGRSTDLTGADAYGLCGEQMRDFVETKGEEFLYLSSCTQLMIGPVDELWDKVAIIKHPSKEEFVTIAAAPEVAGFGTHRAADLEGQLLIGSNQDLG